MKLTIEIKAKDGKFQELYQTLYALLPSVRKQKGCLDCRIYKDSEDDNIFFLSFDWEDQSVLDYFLRSNSGSAFLGAVEVLGETSRVKIGNAESSHGIDVLKRMRKET